MVFKIACVTGNISIPSINKFVMFSLINVLITKVIKSYSVLEKRNANYNKKTNHTSSNQTKGPAARI